LQHAIEFARPGGGGWRGERHQHKAERGQKVRQALRHCHEFPAEGDHLAAALSF